MTTIQDCFNSVVEYLQANMASVGDGTIASTSIVEEGDSTARGLPIIISTFTSGLYAYMVGGYALQEALLTFTISAQTKAVRNTLREDICTTLLAGKNSIDNTMSLIITEKRNLASELGAMDEIGSLVIYRAVTTALIYYS